MLADRLDPDGLSVFFDEGDHVLDRRSSSAWAKYADALRKIGRLAGIEDAQLQACLRDEDKAKALIKWYQANAGADDISSTPTLIVNGTKHSNMSYEDLKKILDAELEG